QQLSTRKPKLRSWWGVERDEIPTSETPHITRKNFTRHSNDFVGSLDALQGHEMVERPSTCSAFFPSKTSKSSTRGARKELHPTHKETSSSFACSSMGIGSSMGRGQSCSSAASSSYSCTARQPAAVPVPGGAVGAMHEHDAALAPRDWPAVQQHPASSSVAQDRS
ncbi:unnamed protein product, partial [Amoebophrya sp. A25]